MADRKAVLNASNPLGRRPQLGDLTESMLDKQLFQSSDGGWLFKQFKLTNTGLEIHGAITRADWRLAGEFFRKAGGALQWWLGDWINNAPNDWGDMYTEAVEITGYKESYLRNIALVARAVELSLRSDKLSYSHHVLVAGLKDEKDKMEWLKSAEEKRLSVAEMRREMEQPPETDDAIVVYRTYRNRFSRMCKFLAKNQLDRVKADEIDDIVSWLLEIKSLKEGRNE